MNGKKMTTTFKHLLYLLVFIYERSTMWADM